MPSANAVTARKSWRPNGPWLKPIVRLTPLTRLSSSWQDTVRRLEAELAQARQQLAEARRQAYRAESQQRRAGETLSRLRG